MRRDELGRAHLNQDCKDTDNQLAPQLRGLEAEEDWHSETARPNTDRQKPYMP